MSAVRSQTGVNRKERRQPNSVAIDRPIADLSIVCVDDQPKHAIEGSLVAQLFVATRT